MLLKGYRKEIFRAECNPSFESVHCFAHLDEDVSEVLPYLNTELGGDHFVKDPPSVTFRIHGRLITVHARKIAINALKDEAEADKILTWLKSQINDAWEHRSEIEPCFENTPKPKLIEILKLLPKTNCRECGQPTCMVFSALAVEGGKGADDCPPLKEENRGKLREYLGSFKLDYWD
ncbi:MAG: Fe-S cluster protein [Deltaproteobacteria bacterium]|nr:MAG: Fe-S cluster protein [Deltaproteobacteria bacterium]